MISAILVDDEQKSIKNLELLLKEHCKEINVIGVANNALEAIKLTLEKKPDVVFLDVQMPGYNGFDVMDNIKETNSIFVFTTAHEEYAVKALRKGAFDYLLKPIDTDELKNCVTRIQEEFYKKKNQSVNGQLINKIIEVAVKDGIIFIKPNDLIRIEASGSYTVFYLDNNIKHMSSKNMKYFETFLDPSLFFRCHKSHIINLKKVIKLVSNNGFFAQMNDGSLVELSRKSKDVFLEMIKI